MYEVSEWHFSFPQAKRYFETAEKADEDYQDRLKNMMSAEGFIEVEEVVEGRKEDLLKLTRVYVNTLGYQRCVKVMIRKMSDLENFVFQEVLT